MKRSNWSGITAPGVFVVATWIAMTAAALAFVAWYTSPYPFGDEWDLVPGTVGQVPFFNWLWQQHNEHRLPLPKLVYWCLLNVTGQDVRAGSYATVLVLASLSASFIMTVRRLRGHTEYSDAFFPVAILNWGGFENYLIGFQLAFAMSAALACAWLLGAIRGRLPYWTYFIPVLLVLCGAHGLAYVPPLGIATLWLTRRESPSRSVVAWIAIGSAFALIPIYFWGYQRPTHHPASGGIFASLTIATEVLALSWGWVAQMTWPLSGAFTWLFIVATGGILTWIWRVERRQSSSALPFVGGWLSGDGDEGDFNSGIWPYVALSAGTIALALGIGWGRSGFGQLAGFADRYVLLAFPVVGASYLVWSKFGGRIGNSLVPMAMFTIACLMLTQHCRTGIAEGKLNARLMQSFENDLCAGYSPSRLATRYPAIYPQPNYLAQRLRLMKNAGVSRYQSLGPEYSADANRR